MDINGIMKLRRRLIENQKRLHLENPDNLNEEGLQAIDAKISELLNGIDMSIGYGYHDNRITKPVTMSKEMQTFLFGEFLDWYEIIPSYANLVYHYVINNYPSEQYKKIICVGDGENCHLGRKLADKGYKVVVVDSVSEKGYSFSENEKGGSLHVVQGEFFDTSTDMIDWADIVVGAKVPQCAEDLTKLNKPTVFTISNNPEIYDMRFAGKPILSAEQLTRELEKTPGLKRKKYVDYLEHEISIFVCDGKERERSKGEER